MTTLCGICCEPILPGTETKEHVIPKSWYPDDTPKTINRWTVPSHKACNNLLGRDEKYTLSRLAAAIDPNHPAAVGIWKRVRRSFSHEAASNEKDSLARASLRASIQKDIIRLEDSTPEMVKKAWRSLTNAEPAQSLLLIDPDRTDPVFQKIGRCIAYQIQGRPWPKDCQYAHRLTRMSDFTEAIAERGNFLTWYDLGPGVKVGFSSVMEKRDCAEIAALLLWESAYVEMIASWTVSGN